ncbi:MAG: OmpA family protein [Acetobacteraceae bacterium]|nr:OmpA family protein [Acetobacteraceae bacterium]
MRLSRAVLTTILLTSPLAAVAQPIEGLYVGFGAGMVIPQNTRASPDFPTGSTHLRLVENLGAGGVASVGYALGNGMRFEVEGDYLRNGIRQLGRTPFPAAADGTVRTYGVMANALFDMDIGFPWLYPYIGLGAGYQWTHLKNLTVTQVDGPFSYATNATAGAFAWQAIAGLSFPIPNMPGLSATTEYRFMQILGGEKFDGAATFTAGGPAVPARIELHSQFDHAILIGVRYAFNVPPPPVPAAPAPAAAAAPAPARSYLVFFDWDKANLTERARAIVKEAAENSTRVQYTRIEVNGYTDTSGTPRYNQGLSVRRARAVAAELVRNGVPQSAIAIKGFGETHLLVPTGPGVREPQNRRVEIIIQ